MPNNHYVPQFYLKHFAISGKPGYVYLYKRYKKPFPRPISRVASGEGYYTIQRADAIITPTAIDEVYQTVEDKAAPIILRLVSCSQFDLPNEDKNYLSNFVASLAFRTPWARETAKNLNLELKKREFKSFAANREAFEKFAKTYDPDLEADEIEQRRLMMMDLEAHATVKLKPTGENESYFMAFGLILAQRSAPTLHRKNWHLIELSSSSVFVTSDNPVIRLTPPNFRPGMRVGFDNAAVLLPISPKRALLLDNRRHSDRIITVGEQQAIESNWHVINHAYSFVFANLLLKEIQEAFDETEEGANAKVALI